MRPLAFHIRAWVSTHSNLVQDEYSQYWACSTTCSTPMIWRSSLGFSSRFSPAWIHQSHGSTLREAMRKIRPEHGRTLWCESMHQSTDSTSWQTPKITQAHRHCLSRLAASNTRADPGFGQWTQRTQDLVSGPSGPRIWSVDPTLRDLLWSPSRPDPAA